MKRWKLYNIETVWTKSYHQSTGNGFEKYFSGPKTVWNFWEMGPPGSVFKQRNCSIFASYWLSPCDSVFTQICFLFYWLVLLLFFPFPFFSFDLSFSVVIKFEERLPFPCVVKIVVFVFCNEQLFLFVYQPGLNYFSITKPRYMWPYLATQRTSVFSNY